MKKNIISIILAGVIVLSVLGGADARADFIPDGNELQAISENEILEINDSTETSSDQITEEIYADAHVNVHMLNLRCGPGTDYSIVHVLKKNDSLKIFGLYKDWYIVQDVKSGFVGCVNENYITFNTSSDSGDSESAGNTDDNKNETDEEKLFRLINEVRKQNGLAPLVLSNTLSKAANDKAADMVENNYFSHNSPVYGTPFEMMKMYGVNFSLAAENIAGNQSAAGAAFSWTNSEEHLANILNSDYTATGIGVCVSPVYGKIFVQLFTD